MYYVIASCFAFIKALSILSVIAACEVRPDSNFTKTPEYWCEVDAKTSITSNCDVEVEETITVPWTTGMINRYIPTDDHQTVKNISAYLISKGQQTSTYAVARPERPPGNVLVSIRAAATQGPVTILVKYRKSKAVQMFTHCSGIGEFAEVTSSLESTLMMSKWAVGARSTAEVLRVQVRFILPREPQFLYLDTQALVRDVFNQTVDNQADEADAPTIVSYKGLPSGILSSELFFYIRYKMRYGSQTCSFPRSCEAEDLIIAEGRTLRSNHKLVLGIALGVGFFIVIASTATWICCCRWLKQKEEDQGIEGDVPDSLRHFTHDTGDGQERRERGEGTEGSAGSSGKKEEFYALDLSPKNRGKREDTF